MMVLDAARLSLLVGPTPLVPAPRLSKALGIEVWFKRDDLTGRGLGGNKIRALEFLLGDARQHGCDSIVTGAGPQSNWAMLAALTARTVGLAAHLVYYGEEPASPKSGNLGLARSVADQVRFTGDSSRESVDVAIEELGLELTSSGNRPYVVPRGGATPIGSLGYASAAHEMYEQISDYGISDEASIWMPTGSCGSQAGLVAGTMWLGWRAQIVGVTVSRPASECVSRVRQLATETLELMTGDTHPIDDVRVVDGYIGPKYGVASAEGLRAADLVAKLEGVFLDPVFGAKAMAALIDATSRRTVRAPVIFVVTGGAPTLFVEDLAL